MFACLLRIRRIKIPYSLVFNVLQIVLSRIMV